MSNKELQTIDGYAIISHGGIGDELGEDDTRDKPRHNLTGSCHELCIRIGDGVLRILIDVGAYQGGGRLERNISEISAGVGAIILTHPHMDHIGDLPRVFAKGREFLGRVFATLGTKRASEIALVDAANILTREYEKKFTGYKKMMEEIAEAFYNLGKIESGEKMVPRNKRNGNRMNKTGETQDKQSIIDKSMGILNQYGITKDMKDWRKEMEKNKPEEPPYTIEDVYETLSNIETQSIEQAWKEIVPGQVAFRFYNAGHIIGSVSVLFRITYKGKNTYVLFSGDLGSYKWDIHPTGIAISPHNLPIDTVVIESTYGSRVRESFEAGFNEFKLQLKRDLSKYRRVTIAAFAMDRTQNILARLVQMKRDGEIDAEIILDSPAGTKHTMAYVDLLRNPSSIMSEPRAKSIRKLVGEDYMQREGELLEQFRENINPLYGYYQIADDNNRESLFSENGKPKIIVTASGMADGGMVVEHLRQNIGDPTTVFYFPGYLVPGTLGHSLAVLQQKLVHIIDKEGKKVPCEVNARMKQFNFLSGHGDAEDLKAWIDALKFTKSSRLIVVHGDVRGSSLELKHSLQRKGFTHAVKVPNIGEETFVPFAVPKEVKGTKKLVQKSNSLIVSPKPEIKRVIPPKTPSKNPKKPSNTNTGDIKNKGVIPSPMSLMNAKKLGGNIIAERKRYTSLISEADTMYHEFLNNIVNIPIPFLAEVRRYYQDMVSLEEVELNIRKTQLSIDTNNRLLQNLSSPKNSSNKQRKESLNTDSIYEIIRELEHLKKVQCLERSSIEGKIASATIQEKITPRAVSRGILECLGFTSFQVKVSPVIVPIENEDELDNVILETILNILKLDETSQSLLALYEAAVSIIPSTDGSFGQSDRFILDQVGKKNSGLLYGINANLISRVNPQYILRVRKKQSSRKSRTTTKKLNTQLERNESKVSPRLQDVASKKELIQKEIQSLGKEKLNYSIFYIKRLETLEKDKTRLTQSKRAHELGHTISRGKYKDYTLDEIISEMPKVDKEILQLKKKYQTKLKAGQLIDDADKYAKLLEAIASLNGKLSRLK